VDQADHLRTLAMKSQGPGSQTRVIAVTSGKGGVGKTNIAVGMAMLFAKRGLKTLVVDADLGLANVNILVGKRVDKSIDDVMFGQAKMSDIFVDSGCGFSLLPSSSGLRKMLDLDAFTQRALFDQLFDVMKSFDIVIYDTAPGLGSHVLNFNSAAHDIVVVSHPEPTSLADSYALIKVLNQEKREKRFKLLINRTDKQTEGLDAFKRLTDVSNEFLNISIDLLGAIPNDPAVSAAVKIQRPVVEQAPKSAFVVALERVVDKLLAGANTAPTKKLWNNGQSLRGVLGGAT
jgi:flagellar biosynthesis protein FlhG